MMNRREARREILKYLYGREYSVSPTEEESSPLRSGNYDNYDEQAEFIEAIYRGTLCHRERLDRLISSYTIGWDVDRLACLDRNILRMAVYEMLFYEETPAEVVMNEAIELAKEYGTENAPKFINGVLDRIWQDAKESPQGLTEGL